MKIMIDAMGGDNAPDVTVQGAVAALKNRSDITVILVGQKELIEEKGRSNGIGRPILYGTTKLFLEKFGFETLKDLPDIEEIDTLIGRDEDEEALETLDALGFQQISLDLNE